MKKLFAVLLITIFTVTFAQNSDDNRFKQAEFGSGQSSSSPADPGNQDEGTPPPVDPVPINDYIPLLFLAAIGIIAVSQYRRTRISKN